VPAYIALVRKDGATYRVSFPDLPGCTAAGDSLDEALANAAEALADHLARMRAGSEPVPSPRTLAELHAATPAELEDALLCPVTPRDALTPVSSDAVRGFDYDLAGRELRIRYKGGADYLYLDVPPPEFDALLAAESKGIHVNTVIKPRYKFRKL
jgi:predicted RNase H-like HicB family nuclease